MPVVIYLGLGTNLSSHTGTSPLARQISALAYQPGIAIVVTGGNEGQAKHHYAGTLSDGEVVVEIKVGPGEYGFTAELWGFQPNQFFVDIESPSGPENRCNIRRLQGQKKYHISAGTDESHRRLFYH